jgi:hypothetical protein
MNSINNIGISLVIQSLMNFLAKYNIRDYMRINFYSRTNYRILTKIIHYMHYQ